jgi:hypothetical protein
VLEESIVGDFALIKAHKADTKGNLVFNLTARNFAVPMAKAGRVCIAEVEEIVPEGALGPGMDDDGSGRDCVVLYFVYSIYLCVCGFVVGSCSFAHVLDEIHLPGIYVQRVVLTKMKEKKIEKLTLSKKAEAGREPDIRDRIAKRVAKVQFLCLFWFRCWGFFFFFSDLVWFFCNFS